jgi:hypothetical protein
MKELPKRAIRTATADGNAAADDAIDRKKRRDDRRGVER